MRENDNTQKECSSEKREAEESALWIPTFNEQLEKGKQ